jgi:glycine/D-amino acid oxidase-like deaminating enzyme
LGSKKEAKIMILGGGLAGLATANHLLNKTTGIAIDIWDVCEVGDGGASAVAGG